jgi:hypothetical protein
MVAHNLMLPYSNEMVTNNLTRLLAPTPVLNYLELTLK